MREVGSQYMEENFEQPKLLSRRHWLFLGLYVLLVVLCLIAGAVYLFFIGSDTGPDEGTRPKKNLGLVQPTTLAEYRRQGNFEAALQELEKIQSKPLKDADEQALAVLGSINVKFNLTADIQDMLADIENLKTVVRDPVVDLRVRVEALNALSASICRSGRDPVVFEEVYKDAPFNSYLAPGDPDLSARYMAEWSYSQLPTSFAAIRIARWYSDQIFQNVSLSTETKMQYTDETKKYLRNAEELTQSELSWAPDRAKSVPYMAYKMWHAVIIGRLAGAGGEPYKSQYKREFEELLSFLKAQKNVGAADYVYLSRGFYARFLLQVDGDPDAAKEQLDLLASELNSLKNPDVSAYVRFVRQAYKDRHVLAGQLDNLQGYIWPNLEKMMAVSPDYKNAVEKIIASSQE